MLEAFYLFYIIIHLVTVHFVRMQHIVNFSHSAVETVLFVSHYYRLNLNYWRLFNNKISNYFNAHLLCSQVSLAIYKHCMYQSAVQTTS